MRALGAGIPGRCWALRHARERASIAGVDAGAIEYSWSFSLVSVCSRLGYGASAGQNVLGLARREGRDRLKCREIRKVRHEIERMSFRAFPPVPWIGRNMGVVLWGGISCSRSPQQSSTSVLISDRLDWGQSHKDLMVMIQEIKKCLPEEKRSSSKPSTISALNYALRCVQQVRGKHGKRPEAHELCSSLI